MPRIAKATNKIVDALNALITTELVAINQYYMHSKLASHWGYERLGKRFYADSIEEMKDTDALMDRVLFLGGLPNLQRLTAFQVGESVPEAFSLARDLEARAIEQLRDAIALCEDAADRGTATLLRPMLLEEEEQLSWVDTQLGLIEQLGEQLYLSQQVHG